MRLQTNDYFVCTCKKLTPKFVCRFDYLKKVSNEKIKDGGESLFCKINVFKRNSLIKFSTLYSTLLYSTTTILHTNNYLTTTFLAICKKLTTFFAGVVC